MESKQITELRSLCDDILHQQFRSELPGEVGVFVDQRNVSSATEMAKLADLFYESNRDGNTKLDARRNYFRGNQPFKPKNFQTPNANFESSKNSVNAVSGDRKPEWVAQKQMASQIRCFHCKMPNHKRSECPRLQPRSNNCTRVGLESQRISGSPFVISLYVNGKLVDGHRYSGADTSLSSRKIVKTGDYLPDKRVKIQGIQGGFCEIPLTKIQVKSPRFGTNENVEITMGVLENLRLADLLLGNDLFQANSKLKDPIEVVNFDVSPSPDLGKATSSESIGNQM